MTLRNLEIDGDLIIDKAVGEGNVKLEGVTVKGNTIINGGGTNSIYFTDSILATVIVNKNNGAVRIIAQGDTEVYEVQLETPARIVEQNLTNESEGFTDIVLTEALQQSEYGVQLEGVFDTINSRATRVKINLSEETDIKKLVLSAVANVLGHGNIQLAEINAEGSTLSQRPQNLVLNIGSVMVENEYVDESYSDESMVAELQSIRADQSSITLELSRFVAGLTLDDFDIVATVNGRPVILQNLQYHSNHQRITFDPLSLRTYLNQTMEIKVTPKHTINGTTKSKRVPIQHGFGGRITDIHGVGMAHAILRFGHLVTQTDAHGYYSIEAPVGTYEGIISGPGYIESPIVATSVTDVFLTNQNETGIRAAASNEIKIMLEWDESPRDLDSHLVRLDENGKEEYHIWYGNRMAWDYNSQVAADLDWDDTDSYGPETTTIRKLKDGSYSFYIHNYSGNWDNTLSNSKAKVKIFKGNSTVPEKVFEVPAITSDDRYWCVFDLEVSDDGQAIQVIEKNQLFDLSILFELNGQEILESNEYVLDKNKENIIELSNIEEGMEISYQTYHFGTWEYSEHLNYDGPITLDHNVSDIHFTIKYKTLEIKKVFYFSEEAGYTFSESINDLDFQSPDTIMRNGSTKLQKIQNKEVKPSIKILKDLEYNAKQVMTLEK